MKFSVIIPMYNSKKTIENSIQSVINQTYNEILEIIVINDGSTDGSEKLVEKIILNNKTNRLIKLLNKTNGGVSSARNMGIRESNGEYIAFLDSDDQWHPQKLEIILELLEKYPIKFLGHAYTIKENFDDKFKIKPPVKISFYKLLLKNFSVTSSIVIERKYIEFFDERITHNEDHELWLRIALKTDFYYLDIPLVKIGRPLLSFGGLSGNKWSMRKGELKTYKKIVSINKKLLIFFPFLVCFSLSKHLRRMISDFIKKLF
ncbi:glycosyltransferase family 2 protein [Deferribacter thermophilus]|uniref:glycosyltransferase family 2 protein n=1 Tax=Deferribacter thermophilus TaxID=53573 RepID=UPI003C2A243F